jgi:hypothetical protein
LDVSHLVGKQTHSKFLLAKNNNNKGIILFYTKIVKISFEAHKNNLNFHCGSFKRRGKIDENS